jgi:hypothetical protein
MPFWKRMEELTVTEQEKQKYYKEVEELLKNPLSLKPKSDSFNYGSGSFKFSESSENTEEFSPKISANNTTTTSSYSSSGSYSSEELGMVGGISGVICRGNKNGCKVGQVSCLFRVGKLH